MIFFQIDQLLITNWYIDVHLQFFALNIDISNISWNYSIFRLRSSGEAHSIYRSIPFNQPVSLFCLSRIKIESEFANFLYRLPLSFERPTFEFVYFVEAVIVVFFRVGWFVNKNEFKRRIHFIQTQEEKTQMEKNTFKRQFLWLAKKKFKVYFWRSESMKMTS